MGKKILNYEICKNKALNCKDRKEFWDKESKAALLSKKNGWIDEWFPPIERKERGYWTKERCIEESKKYSTRNEFDKKCRGAYSASSKNGWLDKFVWLRKNPNVFGKMDCVYAYIFEEYKTVYIGRTIRKEERDKEHIFDIKKDSVAKFAKDNNISVPRMKIIEDNLTLEEGKEREKFWIEEYKKNGFTLLNKTNGGESGKIGGYWTYEKCEKIAKKYKTLAEFAKKDYMASQAAYRHKWIKKFDWLEQNKRVYKIKPIIYKNKEICTKDEITKEMCFEKALQCKTMKEFKMKYYTLCKIAKNNNWDDEYIWFKTQKANNYWTYEKCTEIAKRYKTKKEFHEEYPYLYEISQKNKWLETYTWLLQKNKPNGYWTYEKCYEEAKKYATFNEFRRNKSGAAYRARVNGWVKNYTWFNLKNK